MEVVPLVNWQNVWFACLRTIVNGRRYLRNLPWLYPELQPDLVKTYAGRTDLYPSRVFKPCTNQRDGALLPLVLCVHGGGFLLNNPAMDDRLARHLADAVPCIVVSIDYRKAPQNKFPRAYEDIVESASAIQHDQDLPIDRLRMALVGSSAGGNLVLAAAQDPRLRHQFQAIATLYPLCDWTPSVEDKMATRPDASVPDFIGSNASRVASMYLEADHDLFMADIRLSPTYFATREDLPVNMLFIGAEHDLFCHEAEIMAGKLANGNMEERTEAGWRAGSVQWHKVFGQKHAFDHFPAKDAGDELARIAARDATYTLMSEWLSKVFVPRQADDVHVV